MAAVVKRTWCSRGQTGHKAARLPGLYAPDQRAAGAALRRCVVAAGC